MDITLNKKLEKLIAGKAAFVSRNIGFSLLTSRLQKQYSSNKTSEELNKCVQEINSFLTKYSDIMAGEIEQMKKM
jgi:hypothetical protein